MTRPDSDDAEQTAELVDEFYERVRCDDLLSPVFLMQVSVHWAELLPRLTACWCQQELGLPGHQGRAVGRGLTR